MSLFSGDIQFATNPNWKSLGNGIRCGDPLSTLHPSHPSCPSDPSNSCGGCSFSCNYHHGFRRPVKVPLSLHVCRVDSGHLIASHIHILEEQLINSSTTLMALLFYRRFLQTFIFMLLISLSLSLSAIDSIRSDSRTRAISSCLLISGSPASEGMEF